MGQLPASEGTRMREFIQVLTNEIDATKRDGGSGSMVFDRQFVRQDGPCFIYAFSTESILGIIDEAPTEVEVAGQRVGGYIVSVQGTEVVVGIEHDFGLVIREARLITERWRLLKELKDRFEQILAGQRTINTSLAQKLFEITAKRKVGISSARLALPTTAYIPNADPQEAVHKALGSDISFIWGPPGTGKTDTIGFLATALLERHQLLLVVSHTNIAIDNAIQSVAKLLQSSPLYHEGKLLRLGTIAKDDLSASFFMVTIEGRVEPLGRSLKEYQRRCDEQLRQTQQEHMLLQETTTILAQAEAACQQRERNKMNLARANHELAAAQVRLAHVATQLHKCQTQLARARSVGALKRFFLKLDPIRIQSQITNTFVCFEQ